MSKFQYKLKESLNEFDDFQQNNFNNSQSQLKSSQNKNKKQIFKVKQQSEENVQNSQQKVKQNKYKIKDSQQESSSTLNEISDGKSDNLENSKIKKQVKRKKKNKNQSLSQVSSPKNGNSFLTSHFQNSSEKVNSNPQVLKKAKTQNLNVYKSVEFASQQSQQSSEENQNKNKKKQVLYRVKSPEPQLQNKQNSNQNSNNIIIGRKSNKQKSQIIYRQIPNQENNNNNQQNIEHSQQQQQQYEKNENNELQQQQNENIQQQQNENLENNQKQQKQIEQQNVNQQQQINQNQEEEEEVQEKVKRRGIKKQVQYKDKFNKKQQAEIVIPNDADLFKSIEVQSQFEKNYQQQYQYQKEEIQEFGGDSQIESSVEFVQSNNPLFNSSNNTNIGIQDSNNININNINSSSGKIINNNNSNSNNQGQQQESSERYEIEEVLESQVYGTSSNEEENVVVQNKKNNILNNNYKNSIQQQIIEETLEEDDIPQMKSPEFNKSENINLENNNSLKKSEKQNQQKNQQQEQQNQEKNQQENDIITKSPQKTGVLGNLISKTKEAVIKSQIKKYENKNYKNSKERLEAFNEIFQLILKNFKKKNYEEVQKLIVLVEDIMHPQNFSEFQKDFKEICLESNLKIYEIAIANSWYLFDYQSCLKMIYGIEVFCQKLNVKKNFSIIKLNILYKMQNQEMLNEFLSENGQIENIEKHIQDWEIYKFSDFKELQDFCQEMLNYYQDIKNQDYFQQFLNNNQQQQYQEEDEFVEEKLEIQDMKKLGICLVSSAVFGISSYLIAKKFDRNKNNKKQIFFGIFSTIGSFYSFASIIQKQKQKQNQIQNNDY